MPVIALVSSVAHAWSTLVDLVASHAVAPLLAALHLTGLSDDPHDIAASLLVAALQLSIIGVLFRPLESLWPAERWEHRRLARIDFHYTWLMLIGVFPLFSFLILTPVVNALGGADPNAAAAPETGLRHAWPWLDRHPLALFALYYLAYDFTYYWMHRVQHWMPWWWAMHSMHHSQRQLSCWANDRSNYLDGMLQSFVLAAVGIAFGIEADEFAWLMLLGELVQNLSHANTRFGFGPVLDKLLVDPPFHRLHHMRVDPERPGLHNCNFGQVFAFWDVLFGTALYGEPVRPTGVGDPMVDRDNELGLVALQWEGLKRFWGAVRRRSGWTPGEVAFGEDYAPIPVDHAGMPLSGGDSGVGMTSRSAVESRDS
ncbi:sterol desaturase family protein [uncultured Xanthomonas sp.]|uniref:sterol desaturase family protein n=1 Tax=uncultured Xanthomonas sp. TaxID=152831 RepID=UPI0025DB642A|nr:sterol desaturase family protein [uncultured Xanthomonas sp.]